MRIVHVLTLISADGAYGGPVAVARGQCEALAERGHDVTLVAGWDGMASFKIPGVSVRLHRAFPMIPGAGMAGFVSPRVWLDAARLAREADVIHVHLARDFVTLPAACLAARRTPIVVQTHGMVRMDGRAKARAMDSLLTRRTLRATELQLTLSEDEQRDAPLVARSNIPTLRVQNGVTVPNLKATWDGASPPEVVFCARLHARKRPLAFVEMARVLIGAGINAQFALIGPDEGEAATVKSAIQSFGIADRVSYEGSLAPDQVLSRLARAQVYVLPSVNELFPMGLLEAMSLGLPSVLTKTTGISEQVSNSASACVTDPDPGSLAEAVRHILSTRETWQDWSSRARSEVIANYGAQSVADQLDSAYTSLSSR